MSRRSPVEGVASVASVMPIASAVAPGSGESQLCAPRRSSTRSEPTYRARSSRANRTSSSAFRMSLAFCCRWISRLETAASCDERDWATSIF